MGKILLSLLAELIAIVAIGAGVYYLVRRSARPGVAASSSSSSSDDDGSPTTRKKGQGVADGSSFSSSNSSNSSPCSSGSVSTPLTGTCVNPGSSCKDQGHGPKDVHGFYTYDDEGRCRLSSCHTGYTKLEQNNNLLPQEGCVPATLLVTFPNGSSFSLTARTQEEGSLSYEGEWGFLYVEYVDDATRWRLQSRDNSTQTWLVRLPKKTEQQSTEERLPLGSNAWTWAKGGEVDIVLTAQ